MKLQTERYTPLVTYVERVQRQLGATASALYVWRQGEVTEWYNGAGIGPASRFHVHSVRKSYIGLALALAQLDGKIGPLDTRVSDYLSDDILDSTTLRHLVTNTHGLRTDNHGQIHRDHPPGKGWLYVNTGIDLLLQLVKQQTGQTVSELIQERILKPHGFCETGWETEASPDLVPDVTNEGTSRLQLTPDRNLYVSARELAKWGLLHKSQEGVFSVTTTVQTPPLLDEDFPRHGYCWYVQDDPCARSEIGEFVPRGSFQILGLNGAVVLVIPELDVVAVRMYNKIGNPPGYHYLRDIRDFGNLIVNLSR
ncbi:beta-lactamase family protein [Tumebacillus sp. ITR2]|uniref:Beta-lactamase family protein n=1 Tax=Tumebacillus amylolyticus TaxID=2801339 RepID=A0ABS1JFY9_9BACL|nr:serine hydrolase domain-containing protein [Tumebacillus amylolyticus]MBL0389192.1 beta-lactamase family protein [Tumebacillus amylolyticus]